MTKQQILPGELALALVLIINSFGVELMTKSGFGISSISSVPYVIHKALPALLSAPGTVSFRPCCWFSY